MQWWVYFGDNVNILVKCNIQKSLNLYRLPSNWNHDGKMEMLSLTVTLRKKSK